MTRTTAGKPALPLQYLQPRTQRRNAWFNWGKKGSGDSETGAKSPSKGLADELDKREKKMLLMKRLGNNTQGPSIFDDEIKESEREARRQTNESAASQGGKPTPSELAGLAAVSRLREHTQRALDPDPRWRIRWQKKKVAAMVRARDAPVIPRLARLERIRRTERRAAGTSDWMSTSTKKLKFLSQQIVGKPVDDAIVQMRYSKKKYAREVRMQLEQVRDEAIAAAGMGLGAAPGNEDALLKKPRKIQDKAGKWFEVTDPTRLYVDESWVGKGPYRGARINYGARSRVSYMWRPTSHIAIVLKEEKTRIRQHDERVEKQAKKAPWVHLPNRPVTAQRPYYSW
ncbi:39S ribosomal protein L22, mitochondrial [Diatrype stigma]|uniref:39S ribosomal protein L22, mitochondrial n=1 Tax=Diatrype stigma TaxID=117547 RepID=A0AAN9UHL4_9PEZI